MDKSILNAPKIEISEDSEPSLDDDEKMDLQDSSYKFHPEELKKAEIDSDDNPLKVKKELSTHTDLLPR